MALDNAQFIAELSITDPPGTDPLSQGDDQIRTIKRATQQSFPNIDKAVIQTADQMLQMAIKNEANNFTNNQIITDSNLAFENTGARGLIWRLAAGGLRNWEIFGDISNLNFNRYNSNVFQDIPIQISNTTGIVNFAQSPTIDGAPIWIAGELRMFAAAAVPGTNWFKADGTNGTVNCADRWLAGSGAFAGAAGVGLNAELDAQAAAGVTGSTAITEAQMPAHNHRVWSGNISGVTDVTFDTANTVMGANRGNSGPKYDGTAAGSGAQIIEDTGGGSGHTHSTPVHDVVALNPTFTGSVQPLSRVVDIFQYVP